MRGAAEEKSNEKLAGVSIGEEEELPGSGEETWTKACVAGLDAAGQLEKGEMGMRKVDGKDCRKRTHEDCGARCCC